MALLCEQASVHAGDSIYLLRDTPDRTSVRIGEKGKAEYVHYFRGLIYDYKKGTLSPEELQQLLNFIDSKGFFQMEEKYDFERVPNRVYEPMTSNIIVIKNGVEKEVFCEERGAPDGLKEIIEKILQVIPMLKDSNLYGTFIHAEELDASEAKSLKDYGVVFSVPGEEDLEVKEAVNNIGDFVHVGPLNGIKQFLNVGSHDFYVTSGGRNFIVYVTERK